MWWLTLCSGGCAPDVESRSHPERRLTLRATDGQPIGIVVSAAACDDELYVAEASGAVYRFGLGDHSGGIARLSMTGDAHLQALYAIALDCQAGALYALDPMTRRVVEVDRHTSAYRRQWALPVEANRFTMPAGRLTLVPGPLIAIAGLTFGPPDDTGERSTASYYRGLHLALLLDAPAGLPSAATLDGGVAVHGMATSSEARGRPTVVHRSRVYSHLAVCGNIAPATA